MNWVLFCFREHFKWGEDHIAKRLSISTKEYINLESGFEPVGIEMAIAFSKLYNAPQQVFVSHNNSPSFSIIYNSCHFENSNGYVNHLNGHQSDNFKNDLIRFLKDEVVVLRNENQILLKKLKKCQI